MDFVTHLPWASQGHDAVWVIVDHLTKSAHLLAMGMTFNLDAFRRLYIREIVWLHGVPISIILDPDPRFIAHFWEMFPTNHRDIIGDKHCFSSPNTRSIEEGHLNIREPTTPMRPGS